MPAVQQIFGGFAQVRFSLASLKAFDRELNELQQTEGLVSRDSQPITFNRAISLNDVVYTYPGAAVPALNRVSLVIEKNTTVGLVGTTGSGKSTAVDVLLGLLQPQQGALRVDEAAVGTASVRAWQSHVGYVTQSPHIIDDTVARNIALGVPDTEIWKERLREAASLANLADFIEQQLPEKYNTRVGERGSRLSGGQRQRLCIARALYHDPEVLVFDEATSALDAETEDAIIEAIRSLRHQKTVVMIAHRLASLADCDAIYVFEGGKVIDYGTYESLRSASAKFRSLAGL
jgi:ABC-type multidrug transport system fused ATPase/permease subunit